MTRAVLAITVALAACDAFAPPAPSAMPWARGILSPVADDNQTPGATERMARLAAVSTEPGSGEPGGGGAIELRADATGDGELDTVLASYTGGVLVVGPTGRVIARTAGYDAEGSADDLVALAVGDVQLGAPVVLLATQSGGHRESAVTLTVFRVRGAALRPLFSAIVELHDGDATRTGALLFVPDGLWYRAPDAATQTYWAFDRARGRYVERATIAPPPPPDRTPRVGSGPST